jgi:hypothetical protein
MKLIDRGYQYYKSLPPWGKAVVVIGGVAIAWFGVITPIRKGIQNAIAKSKSKKTITDTVNELKNNTQAASFPDSQYKGWADQIAQQFDGCDYSSIVQYFIPVFIESYSNSGKVLYGIINQLKNDKDFQKLVQAFGVRTYRDCGLLGTWFAGKVSNVSLYAAVNDELNSEEIKGINALLESKGITYRF